ncbi:Arginase/deacetylase [Dendrothele bispora CBS 962.96]|uniref:Arginase/deacetylase n=1 Tax=Dendrothele bispora (strain CBS 962.96) TaxID=1314807 RepID=A0A4S8KTN2_DENBC|nr:Arginase/deacetylase [Dendrothele bispora CBS 962.96]
MFLSSLFFLFFTLLPTSSAHTTHSPDVLPNEPWLSKYGSQHDLSYTGILSFAHLPYLKCLEDASKTFDIAILGFPFDTTTSYRPGARFGPYAIRVGSKRLHGGATPAEWWWDLGWQASPGEFGAGILDCGDAPITPMDNAKALDQMEAAYDTLLNRPVLGGKTAAYSNRTAFMAKDGKEHPRIVTLGGDHTIVLPILRSLSKIYGPISVIHFDAHMDTGATEGRVDQERITHGSYFTIAWEEQLITNTSIHGGIRNKMSGPDSVQHDEAVGFQVISSEDIDDYGINNVIRAIRRRVGDGPVYLSLDIDTVDPSLAPATGTPEVGGWTTREMKRILRGLTGLNFVGADIVEVAPAYDTADITSIAAADFVYEFLMMMQFDEPPKRGHPGGPWTEEDVLRMI